MTNHDLISVSEAAEILCIGVRSVHHRIRSGSLVPAMKLPGATGAYLFPRAAVEALAAERAEKAS